MNQTIMIRDKLVGEEKPVYIVFEAGHTHNGFNGAKELVDVAWQAGADAIKFQAITPERLISTNDVIDEFEVLNKDGTSIIFEEPIIDSHNRQALANEEYIELSDFAHSLGLAFIVTVDFPETVDELLPMTRYDKLYSSHWPDAFKICSGDIDHYTLIEYVAKTGMPIMIDTGNGTLAEVEQAVDVILSAGNSRIVIHHCPSGYPAKLQNINLNIITTLRQMFEFPIAFSDHSSGWEMDIAAVTLGARMIEKTITLDRYARSPEHMMSIEPKEAKEMVRSIRELEVALGNKRKRVTDKEREAKRIYRRSIFLNKDKVMDTEILKEDIDYRRPGDGIPASMSNLVIGRTVRKYYLTGRKLLFKDLK